MRIKLFIASVLAILVVAFVASTSAVAEAEPAVTPEPVKTAQCSTGGQSCCTLDECCGDCCEECILCCSLDGCCEECIQCCIDMGCDPLCCFPALTSAKAVTAKKLESCCAKPAAKTAKACCANGCCK